MTLKELSAQLDRLNFLVRDPEPGLTTWQNALKKAMDDLSLAWMTHRTRSKVKPQNTKLSVLLNPSVPMENVEDPKPEPAPTKQKPITTNLVVNAISERVPYTSTPAPAPAPETTPQVEPEFPMMPKGKKITKPTPTGTID